MKPRFTPSRLALAAILMAAAGPAARAQTVSTWSGATNTTWSTAGNWHGGVPASTSEALFNSSVTNSSANITGTVQIGEVVFSGTTNETIGGTGTLSVNGLSNTGSVQIDNQTTAYTPTIAAAISLGQAGTQTFQADTGTAGLTFSNTVDLTGTPIVIFDAKTATNTITFNGVVLDSSGGAAVTINGLGKVIYAANNTYAGATTISGGTLQLGSGSTAGSVTGNIVDNAALTFDHSNATTYGGVISGSGSVSQAGAAASIVTLTGANTYSGATSVASGTLTMGATNAIGTTSAVTVASAATLNLNSEATTIGSLSGAGTVTTGTATGALTTGDNNTTTTFSGIISGSGSLTQNGTGTLALTGANTYTGGTTISQGGLQIGGGSTTGSITGNITDNAALTFDRSNALTYAGNITGSGSVTQGGTTASNTTLSGTGNTYTGATNVNSGILTMGATNAIGTTSAVTVASAATLALNSEATTIGSLSGAGTVTTGTATGALTTGDNNTTTTFSGIISGSGSLRQNGTGTLVLSGANTYTGGTTITTGTLQIGAGGTTGAIAGNVTDNGTLAFDRSNALTYAGSITGSGGVSQSGTNTLTLTSTGNTYTGATNVNSGTLALGATNAIGTTSAVTVASGAALTLNSEATTIGSLSGAGTVTVGPLAAGALTTGDANTTTTFSGIISGAGAVTQNGTGTLVLSGANTYTGGTTISKGALEIGAGGTTGSIASTTITDNSQLIYNQTDLNTYGGVVSGSGSLTQAGAGTLVLSNANTYSGGTTVSQGALEIGAGSTAGSITGNVTDNASLIYNRSDLTTFSGIVSGSGSVTQAGAGTTTVTAANTYAGGTTVSAGELIAANGSALGSSVGATTVVSGGTLGLSGGINVVGQTGTLTLNGTGSGGNGALANVSGNNSYQGNINVASAATITTGANLLYLGVGDPTNGSSPNSITLNGTLTLNTTSATTVTPTYEIKTGKVFDPTNILINDSGITGSGGIDKTGAGVATLNSLKGNTFTGATSVTGGTLIVDGMENTDGTHQVISSSSITVGNSGGAGAADSVILQTGEITGAISPNNLLGTFTAGGTVSSADLTIYHDGEYLMNSGSDGFNTVTLQGSTINQGLVANNAMLSVGSGGLVTQASSQTALIENGSVGMSATNFNFDVAQGTTASGYDLEVNSIVTNGTGFTGASNNYLDKTGAGTLVFTNANTYNGITDIQGGALNIQNSLGLGQVSSSGFGDTANGTVVESGAQLQLQNNITVADETISLNGTGISSAGSTGALLNVSGSNTDNGAIYLLSDSRIDANAGSTLTIGANTGVTNTILDGWTGGQNLTAGGAGTVALDAGIGADVTNVSKDGTGTLILAGQDQYLGATSVTAGVARIENDEALAGSGAIVSSNATLQFAQDLTGGNINTTGGVSTTINGTGVGNNGAIENFSGNNSYDGNIVLASAARINADSGTTLTMTGTVTGATENLTVGGSGNTNFVGVIGTTTGTLTKDGTGTATLSNDETYTGLTTVSNGTLAFATNNVLGSANTVNVGSTGTTVGAVGSSGTISTNSAGVVTANGYTYGTLSIGNNTDTIKALTGYGLVSFGTLASNSQLTLTGTSTFSGAFNGTGTLIIASGASFTLGNNFNDPNLNIVLDAGGTLNVIGTNSIFGTLDVEGATGSSATLNFSSSLTSVIEFTGKGGLTNSGVNIDSGVTLNVTNWVNYVDYFDSTTEPGDGRFSNPLDQIVFDSPTWAGSNTTWNNYADGPGGDPDNQITPIPEPSFYGAIAVALALALSAGYTLRRRRIAK